MKHRIAFNNLPFLAIFLALASTAALASNTWYVDGVHGKNKNDCKSPQTACKTIGHAISLASSGDAIMVAAATYTENLTIAFSLRLVGSGANTTIIRGRGNTVVTIPNTGARVTLSKVTITNGLWPQGGGINNSGTLRVIDSTLSGNGAFVEGCSEGCVAQGGGIYNSGTLSVIDSTLSGNGAFVDCSQLCSAAGGGIYNSGTLMVIDSTLSGNKASDDSGMQCSSGCGVGGGGIANLGTLTISNSTISGNSTVFQQCTGFCVEGGGGVENGGTLTINNSTFNGNSAGHRGGGVFNASTVTINNSTFSGNKAGAGGGIYAFNTTTLQNSIVANSPSGGNCSGTMTSNGYNLSSDGTCVFNSAGDLNNTDPILGPLQNNGGPTQTQGLLSGSPAIDAGNPTGCTDGRGHLLKTDQRGRPRSDKEDPGGCDMGAYERQSD